MPFEDTTPIMEKLLGGEWRLIKPVVYTTSAGHRIEVPAGFLTDLASVPWGLWNVFPPAGDYTPAAIIHDYLYERQGKVHEGPAYSRAECDSIFLEAMQDMGISWLRRNLMWLAVRVGGRHAWET